MLHSFLKLLFVGILFLIGILSESLWVSQSSYVGQFDRLYKSNGSTGSVHYISDSQEYEFELMNDREVEDSYHFLWKAIQGDFILRADIEPGKDVNEDAEFGWMIKQALSESSQSLAAVLQPNGKAELRTEANISFQSVVSQVDPSERFMIQVRRIGDQFTLKVAVKGDHFQTAGTFEAEFNRQVFAGLFVKTHSGQEKTDVRFRNVRIVKPFPDSETRGQQYLGSRLEVLDIESGNRQILYENEHSFQAPNWTVDGEELIYNSNGYLYKYGLANGEITVLNTGFATNNNNDHVLTFDGDQIAISHHVPDDNNNSTIFMLPIEGSDEPQQVSKSGVGASYLHGISPDNQTVLFTGYRNGKFDIYAADIHTMEEIQLTDTPGLDDGSEYSPDGSFIYYNSNQTGTMQIWRMRSDGSEKEQLTFDERTHDWFPHISPDGQWMVFLSYGLDVDSGDHPFYKEVMLQRMKVDGGEPEVIAYLYGGQGTINVPSWSPDSKKVAFVSNSDRFN